MFRLWWPRSRKKAYRKRLGQDTASKDLLLVTNFLYLDLTPYFSLMLLYY